MHYLNELYEDVYACNLCMIIPKDLNKLQAFDVTDSIKIYDNLNASTHICEDCFKAVLNTNKIANKNVNFIYGKKGKGKFKILCGK